jgi:glycerol-3-phosphate dehydrogenase (NAD(P)+)
VPPRPQLSLPTPGARRAIVLGAGSFGTAVAVLLARGGFRTTLQTRSPEQAEKLESERENKAEVALPRELRVEPMAAGLSRADYVFLGVPSKGLAEVPGSPPGRR